MPSRLNHLQYFIQMMAREGKKGRVPLMETAFNARSLKNKLVALKHAFNKNIVDMCIVNTLNCPFPPAIRWYSKWAKSVTKVPDSEAVVDLEMIHLRIVTLPTLHILGAYLDSSPTVGHATLV